MNSYRDNQTEDATMKRKIGKHLAIAREKKGLTQEQLIEVFGDVLGRKCAQSISNWENGRQVPSVITLIKLSDFYGCDLDHLIGRLPEQAKERGDSMANLKIRFKLAEKGMRYYQLDKILGISEPTRCRMLRNELPEEEQERICKLIDDYDESDKKDRTKMNKEPEVMIGFTEEQFLKISAVWDENKEDFETIQDAIMAFVNFWQQTNQKR